MSIELLLYLALLSAFFSLWLAQWLTRAPDAPPCARGDLILAIDWPTSPTTGQSYTFNGRTWQWTGTGWKRVA